MAVMIRKPIFYFSFSILIREFNLEVQRKCFSLIMLLALINTWLQPGVNGRSTTTVPTEFAVALKLESINAKSKMVSTIYYLPFTIYRLDSKLPSQPQLQTIHFTVIRFVIEAAEVQHAMQNKLRNLLFESEIVFLRLSRSLLYGDDHISQR